jgi:hypothetical protein
MRKEKNEKKKKKNALGKEEKKWETLNNVEDSAHAGMPFWRGVNGSKIK